MDEEIGAILPSNISVKRLFQVDSDNLNVQEESAIRSHSSGYNAAQMVGFQRGPARARNPIQIKFSSSTLTVPEVLHEVKELNNPSLIQIEIRLE